MVKAKVLQAFTDKETRKVHTKDDIINVTRKRYEEINNTIHGKLIAEIKEEETDEQSNRHNVKVDERETEVKDN